MKIEMPSRAALEAATPVEMPALCCLRRALYQWQLAGQRADEMASWAECHPGDEQVSRLVAYLRGEVTTYGGIAVRAVRAYFGDRSGSLLIRDQSSDPALLRVDLDVDAVSVVRPGSADYSTAADVFNLVEAEQAISRYIIAALVPDAHQQARCLEELARVDGKSSEREWHLGIGSHTPASLADLAMMMAMNR